MLDPVLENIFGRVRERRGHQYWMVPFEGVQPLEPFLDALDLALAALKRCNATVNGVNYGFAMRDQAIHLVAAVMIAQHLAYKAFGLFDTIEGNALAREPFLENFNLIAGQSAIRLNIKYVVGVLEF